MDYSIFVLTPASKAEEWKNKLVILGGGLNYQFINFFPYQPGGTEKSIPPPPPFLNLPSIVNIISSVSLDCWAHGQRTSCSW